MNTSRAAAISFTTMTGDGVAVAGTLFPVPAESRGAVVLAHGLPAGRAPAPDPSDEGYPGLARRITSLDLDAAIFNFRGTGASGGHLDIDRWPDDLAAVLDWLDASAFRRRRYAVVGFSAGGAAAAMLSGRDERPDPLITMAAPADYSFLPLDTDRARWFAFYRELGMIREGYPGTPESWAERFLRVKPESALAVSRAGRIYVLHGTADEVVPFAHAARLVRAAGAKAVHEAIANGAHQMRRDERAIGRLLEILRQSFV